MSYNDVPKDNRILFELLEEQNQLLKERNELLEKVVNALYTISGGMG
jgi:hypothetical protein